jgi:ribosomal protein S18 acetylase RimI-like enzyme
MDDFLHAFVPPYSYLYPVCAPDILRKYEDQELSEIQHTCRTIRIEKDGLTEGVAFIEDSPFDTKQLNMKSAKIVRLFCADTVGKKELLEKVKGMLKKEGYAYTSVRIPEDPEWARILEENGFFRVDTIQYFWRETRVRDSIPPGGWSLRDANQRDTEELLALTRNALTYGRFYTDPAIRRDTADDLYCEWVKNSISRKACDEMKVLIIDTAIAGFVTTKNLTHPGFPECSIGSIELLVVASAFRGKGFGKILVREGLASLRSQRVSIALIDTQEKNVPAFRTYVSEGFTRGSVYMTYRLLL